MLQGAEIGPPLGVGHQWYVRYGWSTVYKPPEERHLVSQITSTRTMATENKDNWSSEVRVKSRLQRQT